MLIIPVLFQRNKAVVLWGNLQPSKRTDEHPDSNVNSILPSGPKHTWTRHSGIVSERMEFLPVQLKGKRLTYSTEAPQSRKFTLHSRRWWRQGSPSRNVQDVYKCIQPKCLFALKPCDSREKLLTRTRLQLFQTTANLAHSRHKPSQLVHLNAHSSHGQTNYMWTGIAYDLFSTGTLCKYNSTLEMYSRSSNEVRETVVKPGETG